VIRERFGVAGRSLLLAGLLQWLRFLRLLLVGFVHWLFIAAVEHHSLL
jgi:hypothetical protein